MEPDLELVGVRDDQSFKIWSHGYPFRTVRWHFHPEYELHLVTATAGRSLRRRPHRPLPDRRSRLRRPEPAAQLDQRRSGRARPSRSAASCCSSPTRSSPPAWRPFPSSASLQPLLKDAFRGIRFDAGVAERVGPLMRDLLDASDARRIALFIEHPRPDRPRREANAARQHRLPASALGLSVDQHEPGAAAYRAQLHPRAQRDRARQALPAERQHLLALLPQAHRHDLRPIRQLAADRTGLPASRPGRSDHHGDLLTRSASTTYRTSTGSSWPRRACRRRSSAACAAAARRLSPARPDMRTNIGGAASVRAPPLDLDRTPKTKLTTARKRKHS